MAYIAEEQDSQGNSMTSEPPVVPVAEMSDGASTRDQGAKATRRHIRGSSILFAGRLISIALNFGVQVLTVRYLLKSDYGAFAYALSIASIGASVALFGLDKAVARFIPIYEECGEDDKMLGTIVMTLLTILGIGAALVLGVIGFRGLIGDRF